MQENQTKLQPIKVQGRLEELETLRLIRNECRFFMTRHTSEIQPEEQKWWWDHIKKEDYTVFLYYVDKVPVGYGLIRVENGVSWLTGGLREAYRGKGLGRQIFIHLITQCSNITEIWLQVRASVSIIRVCAC